MGGFVLAGKKHVFSSKPSNICMCYGLYGFIDEADETILIQNDQLNLSHIMHLLSNDLLQHIQLLVQSHSETNFDYVVSPRETFTVPSYWNPYKKLQI